jgi:hypothetical protein
MQKPDSFDRICVLLIDPYMHAHQCELDRNACKYLELLILCDLPKAQDPLGNCEGFRYRLTDKGLRIARYLAELQFALQPLLQKPI